MEMTQDPIQAPGEQSTAASADQGAVAHNEPSSIAKASGRDHTTMVSIALGGVLLAVGAIAVVLGTSGGSKEPGPQAASAAATTTGAAVAVGATTAARPPAVPMGGAVPAGPAAAQGALGAPGAAPAAPDDSSPHAIAGALRRDATISCRGAQWAKCKSDLDEAARLDPAGDKVAPVQRMRGLIQAAN
jgi:hypothetical protein